MTHLYENELGRLGLTAPQFTLLQALGRAGTLTQGQLGRILSLDSTTLSRTLRPLEAKGWVRIEAGSDLRERHLALTGRGRGKLGQVTPAWGRAQARLRRQLGADRWQALLRDLATLADAARRA